jgi:hypothetical protein
MTGPLTAKMAFGVMVLVLGAGVVITIPALKRHQNSKALSPASMAIIVPSEIVHSAAWYVAHPAMLKQDETRCAGDAASIPQAACQNADSADLQLSINDMKSAASGATDVQKSP